MLLLCLWVSDTAAAATLVTQDTSATRYTDLSCFWLCSITDGCVPQIDRLADVQRAEVLAILQFPFAYLNLSCGSTLLKKASVVICPLFLFDLVYIAIIDRVSSCQDVHYVL